MYKPRPITGFPEYLPEVRLVEQRWIDTIRTVFERYGYASLETASVEETATLAAKGADVDKEIYGLVRLGGEADTAARLALHYDLTVPLARYVAQHYGSLAFPFKRYQIQRVWRGERPQEGRYREFRQCDVDVIDNDAVAPIFDAEIATIAVEALSALSVGSLSFGINDRKILQGFYRGLGIHDPDPVIRIVDKIDKLPEETLRELLRDTGIDRTQADACLRLAAIRTDEDGLADAVADLGIDDPLLREGVEDVRSVVAGVRRAASDHVRVRADLSIARGLDYYTGIVYEARFADFPEYPTICAGGRYENLVGSFINRRLPGVGISIGLTRIFAKLLKEGRLPVGASCPTDVLVVRFRDADGAELDGVARALRRRGVNVEVYHEADKVARQIRYAERRGVRFVWFTAAGGDAHRHEIKDLTSGEQVSADPAAWLPPRLSPETSPRPRARRA